MNNDFPFDHIRPSSHGSRHNIYDRMGKVKKFNFTKASEDINE